MRKKASKVIGSRQRQSSEAVSLGRISFETEKQQLHEDGQVSRETIPSTSATQQRQEKGTSLLLEWSNLTLSPAEQKQKLLSENTSNINNYQSKMVENADESSNNNKNISSSSNNCRLLQQDQVGLLRDKGGKDKNVHKKLKKIEKSNITEEKILEQIQALGKKRKISNQEKAQETLQQLGKRSMRRYEKFVVDQSESSGDKKLEKLLKPLHVKDILNDMDHDWKFVRDEMTDGSFSLIGDHDHESSKKWIRALDKYIQNLLNSIAIRRGRFQLSEKLFEKFAGLYSKVLKVAENSAHIGDSSSRNSINDTQQQLLVEMVERLQDLEEVVKEINELNMFQKETLAHVLYHIDKDIGWFSSAAIASRPLTMAEKLRQSSDR